MNITLTFVLMVLTAYRATRLITKDDFPPLLWLRDRLAGGWRPLTEKEWVQWRAAPALKPKPFPVQSVDDTTQRWVERKSWSPHWLAELVTCPWCASAYLSGALTLAVDLTVGLPVPWLVGPAVWAATALLASREWA